VTTFPASLNLASTWDENLVDRFGTALGQEWRAKGANMMLGPAAETHRVPRNGRNHEYIAGESPYLGARLIKPLVKAVQSQKVLVSAKHFVGNHQEDCRRTSNSIIDARTRHEMYYPQFEAAIQAGVAAIMCGYNMVNGLWNCGSDEILKEDLRGKLGFEGWVQSDWWAFHSFEMGLQGGVDQEMPGTSISTEPDRTTRYTNDKLDCETEERINAMVRPQLHQILKHGLAEPSEQTCQQGSCTDKLVGTVVTNDERQNLAKEIATEAVVLLKNEGNILPLATVGISIAILGGECSRGIDWNDADDTLNWFARNPLFVGGSGRGIPKGVVTVRDSLITQCQATGCTVTSYEGNVAAEAIAAAQGADVAIMCGYASAGEEIDRKHLEVDNQVFMVEVAAGLSTPLVALTWTPGTILMPWINNVDAAMNLFAPGKWYGAAFKDNIFGYHNPSAKSPIFYPITEEGTTLPADCPEDSSQEKIVDIHYTEKLNVAWHGFDPSNILFPFGFGLSYTTFGYGQVELYTNPSDVEVSCLDQDADRGAAVACVAVDVENTGPRDGREIVQLYMKYPDDLGEPPKVLRGFVKMINLTPGQSSTARLPIYRRDLQTYSAEAGDWQDHQGRYTFYVGRHADDEAKVLTWDKADSVATAFV